MNTFTSNFAPHITAMLWSSSPATPPYGTAQLRQDLDRFTFLLGGDDGESLFGPDAAG
jgi:hypothetical protein